MNKKYKERIHKRVKTYCESTYEKIPKGDMRMGKGLFNHRCQLNATQRVQEGKATEVYAVIAIDGDRPIVHFINKDKDGLFVDNTLGFEYSKYDYYMVKKVVLSEYHKMDEVLMDLKRSLLDLHSNGLLNKLLRVDEYNVGI